ncbi:MAG: co-regulatory protein PtrA N-terminal domain-containing protein [Pseudomonas sp.]|uniref:co-regulatory protein PtrA N-terminal domain-containing protein n=1 Tax=Pseudomonas sp. TaxID=306 RepID=UPI003D6F202B
MKIAQLSIFATALVMSSMALAEGGGDRTFEKSMVAKERSMELYVAKEKAQDPVVVNEKKDDNTKDL